ncbi:MAG: copper amine oxidase N-terminal domain-containing protein [Candidatus Eremiobacteraeota bacterium]|nr:copper amine oxidase N-terminal domain-containing protein [Candidatus Eremiobacteraeota bacterium]
MKYFLCVLSAVFLILGIRPALADAPGPSPLPTANFGSPPSGSVPILFNDRHVYANPSTLRHDRVLAGLVKDGELMVPLRSMFEQMGATVSYDPATKSAAANKPGSNVQITLGKPEVLINGESRPLDVPPTMYKGVLLVPVRVISEALGAYVQWVPDQRVTVVRYVAPTPVPTPAPTVAPTPVPTPSPTPQEAAWRVDLTPYLWLPQIFGTVNYTVPNLIGGGTGTLSFQASPNDYLNHFNSAAMFTIDAKTKGFDAFSDFMWMNFSNTNMTTATVTGPRGREHVANFNAGARLVTNIWTVGVGVPVIDSNSFKTVLFVGGRFTQPKSSVNWDLTTSSEFLNRFGSASFNTTIYQFIGGIKGDVYLSPDQKFYFPYYVDLGSGTHASTWQYAGGLGWGRNGSLVLMYRGLAYTSSAGHLPNIRFAGPLVGYTFRF